MLEILQFIFSSVWIWLGFTINVFLIVAGLSDMLNININHYNKDKEPEDKDKQ